MKFKDLLQTHAGVVNWPRYIRLEFLAGVLSVTGLVQAGGAGLAGTPLNFGVGADMVFLAPLRDMDDAAFDVRAFEINIGAPVDPHFDFLATLAWEDGEFDLEEAWVSTIFPGNLKLQFGRELLPFGYLNRIHEHDFPQVDQPVVIEGLTTETGLIGDGAHLAFLAPLINPTLTLITGVYDQIHNSVGRRIDGFPVLGRIQSYYESENGRHAVLAGVSYLNSFGDRDSMEDRLDGEGLTSDPLARGKMNAMYGFDVKYKYSPGRLTYEGLTLGSEYLRVSYDAYEKHADFVPGQSIGADEGFYVYAEWDFDRFRGVGYRYDRSDVLFSSLEDNARIEAHSVYYQWRPTEFSRMRLQYQYRDEDLGDAAEHLVMLQGTFFLGWHPPHRF